jgi:hypothetical protein
MTRWALILLLAACTPADGNNMAGEAGNQAAGKPAEAPPSMAPPADARAAGRYRMAGSPDEVVAFELLPDGQFRFMMAAGAVDQRAEGRWASDGRTVTLNTWPRPTPPEFRADPVTRGGEAPFTILVKGPDGRGLAAVDLRVGLASQGNVFNFTLVPNDFGVMDFRDEQFEISGRDLISHRNGRATTFRREE